jgi:hypothetical protein
MADLENPNDPDSTLTAIRPPDVPPSDEKAVMEDDALDLYREGKLLELEDLAQNLTLRRKFARRVFLLTAIWLAIVVIIILFAGFRATYQTHQFQLADNVLLALIGSTTANILGIFVIVVHYLFPQRSAS